MSEDDGEDVPDDMKDDATFAVVSNLQNEGWDESLFDNVDEVVNDLVGKLSLEFEEFAIKHPEFPNPLPFFQ